MDKQDDTLNVRISAKLRLRLEIVAQREQRSLSNVVRVALGEWVEQKEYVHGLIACADGLDRETAK